MGVEAGEAVEEMGAKEIEGAGDGDEDGDAVEADAIEETRGFELGLQVEFGGEDGWNPETHELSEDVAEREAVEETEGMKGTLVAAIFGDLALDGVEAGENVAMGVDDAFGGSGGAGGEDDLEGAVEGNGGGDAEVGSGGGESFGEGIEGELGDGGREGGEVGCVGEDEPGGGVGDDAGGKVG